MVIGPPLPQMPTSRQNGVCIPQRRYDKGADRGLPTSQVLVLFALQDGSYIPVTAAMEGDHAGLIDRNLPALGEARYTITLRFEVNGPDYLQ